MHTFMSTSNLYSLKKITRCKQMTIYRYVTMHFFLNWYFQHSWWGKGKKLIIPRFSFKLFQFLKMRVFFKQTKFIIFSLKRHCLCFNLKEEMQNQTRNDKKKLDSNWHGILTALEMLVYWIILCSIPNVNSWHSSFTFAL